MIYYTLDHEYVRIEDGVAYVGITNYAQSALGDITYVDMPIISTLLEKGQSAAVVDSVKAASDIYAPISGEVLETNPVVESDPSVINSDPENSGWFWKQDIQDISELDSLMTSEDYLNYITLL